MREIAGAPDPTGDRYAAAQGTFSDGPGPGPGSGRALTLVEGEVLDELRLPDGRALAAHEARRNIVTRGVRLDDLIGRHFRIGTVACYGQRRCEPCAHLQRLTHPAVLRALVHRGGLRADILSDGDRRRRSPVGEEQVRIPRCRWPGFQRVLTEGSTTQRPSLSPLHYSLCAPGIRGLEERIRRRYLSGLVPARG